MTIDQMVKVKKAVQIILDDKKSYDGSLNWAVNYCRHALTISNIEDLRVQCLYILSNITHWRHPFAKEVRSILKEFTENK